MRPVLRLLEEPLVERILSEARELLRTLGVEIQNKEVLGLLSDHGARVELPTRRAFLGDDLLDRALAAAPKAFRLHDVLGNETHCFSGDNVYFTPGSAAIFVLDHASGELRRPTTADYVAYTKVVSGLANIASQSTALIPQDVPEPISDSYRLFLSLLYCEKPVVTGAFTTLSVAVMHAMQAAVRGGAKALREQPLSVFSCCPTSPLKWSDVTSQNLLDCARAGVPVELIAMPLSGFVAPVTLVGTLIQHSAETLSGVAIAQLAAPGAPLLWGGSPAVFDVRHETTPMGAIETMMLDCAASQIGKRLGLPTQGYIALSDAKRLDAQAGLESGTGAILAALAGINNVSGPGMLDFESCQSLEKLVLDNEACGMAQRLLRGIEPREDFPALPLFQELLRDEHLLIASHTRRHLREQITFPSAVIERRNRSRWLDEGAPDLGARARQEVERLTAAYVPSRLAEEVKRELVALMAAEARRAGMDALPARTP